MPLRRPILCLALVLVPGLSAARADLSSPTRSVTLPDAFAGQQLLVAAGDQDVTREASYASANPAVAKVDATGYVSALGNGSTTIRVTHAAGKLTIPVDGRRRRGRRAGVDFRTEVEPLLSKLGCNAGGCHGKASGQNGFKLSLFGFDADFDYAAIAQEARGRRVFPAAPDRSLFLLKASRPGAARRRQAAHARTAPTTRLIRRWIAAGDAGVGARTRRASSSCGSCPTDRVLRQGPAAADRGAGRVHATASVRDVTRQSEFASNLDVVASVDVDGLVQGASTQAARRRSWPATWATSPSSGPSSRTASRSAEIPDFKPINYVDELAVAKWKKLGLRPSPVCDDASSSAASPSTCAAGCRRRPRSKAFLADTAADKRAKLIDRLLDSPDYPAYFAHALGQHPPQLEPGRGRAGGLRLPRLDQGHDRPQPALRRVRPRHRRGGRRMAGRAGRSTGTGRCRDDQLHQVDADTAQVFLGMRLQCAKCHHHPYERWGQDDYYGLAGFFTRLGRKSFGEPPPYYAVAPRSPPAR